MINTERTYNYAGQSGFPVEQEDIDWISKIGKLVFKKLFRSDIPEREEKQWLDLEQRCWRVLDKKYGVNFFNYGIVGDKAYHK